MPAHTRSRGMAPPQRRPAPALAADINELLESMARKRVPRLDGVRERLQQVRTAGPLTEVEDALHNDVLGLWFPRSIDKEKGVRVRVIEVKGATALVWRE